MAGGMDWFRWHHGSVTDPKFQLVARKAGARLGDVIAVWAFVLEKASADADRGAIGQLDFETIDFLLGGEEGVTTRILDAMTARGLITGNRIAKWDERQPKREREDDGSAERKRQQREREAAVRQGAPAATTDGSVTPSHTTSHQKKPRGEEKRGEKKEGESAPAKPARAARGDRFAPEDFEVTPAMQVWAAESAPLVDWQRETEKFRDWEFKHPRSDWDKVWRTWLRKAQDDATGKQGGPRQASVLAGAV